MPASRRSASFAIALSFLAALATRAFAQSAPEGEAPALSSDSMGDPPPSDAALNPDAGAPPGAADTPAPNVAPEEHGDKPIEADDFVNEQRPGQPQPAPVEPPPTPTKPGKPAPSSPGIQSPQPPEVKPPVGPAIIWATSGWASALGGARCGDAGLEGADTAIRIGSSIKQSSATAGLGFATAGALADHPLLNYAAHRQPERVAELFAHAGFSALAIGVADMAGPLPREPRLAAALQARGVRVLASNLECQRAAWCESWDTAEDPLPIIERNGRRYALMVVLPDDLLNRVEPSAPRSFQLQPALATMARRTEEALAAGADLVVASIDHGPDATAAVNLANFVAQLPVETRPDLLLSPSSGENLLFMRPLDVQPAIVGTRRNVLTGVRVTKLDGRDTDVLARSVKLSTWDDELASRVHALGRDFCRATPRGLAGGHFEVPIANSDFVNLAGAAVRELASADLALVDPHDYDPDFTRPGEYQLQRAEAEHSVAFDAPLVTANVTLDWLANMNKMLEGLRPLTLIGVTTEKGDTLIAGRLAVTGASYRIVTTSVLARSNRVPAAAWSPFVGRHASVRGALMTHMTLRSSKDPRTRLRDPLLGVQWVMRADGQVQANLTAVQGRDGYSDEPALQVDESRQLGGRLVVNIDADAPRFLFENVGQVAFDRNFVTNNTAQDLTFMQNTYTYRGLWPSPLLYPHPFAENYIETSFLRGSAPYQHLMLRPKLGIRSIFSRVFSLKVSFGVQYEVFDDNRPVYPGVGAELVLKPWTVALPDGTLQLEGNLTYFWSAPGRDCPANPEMVVGAAPYAAPACNDHMLRGQLISAFQLIGPLQFTLSALAVMRKRQRVEDTGLGLSVQAGIRLRFVSRSMVE